MIMATNVIVTLGSLETEPIASQMNAIWEHIPVTRLSAHAISNLADSPAHVLMGTQEMA